MGIKITAKVQGFRRAGLAHHGTAVYPGGHFTPEQLAALKAEKNLVVEEVEEDGAPPPPPDPDKGPDEAKAKKDKDAAK